jgi:hypothetical protein
MHQRFLTLQPGAEIPKPEADEPFRVSGWGTRRGADALIYEIPNRKGGRPYKKGVTTEEFFAACHRLRTHGEFTAEWARAHLGACVAEGWCNFTTIGGIMELFGLARYAARGRYEKTRPSEKC